MTEDRKQNKRKLGLCYYCGEPAIDGHTACQKHHESHYRAHRKYVENNREKLRLYYAGRKQQRKKEGRCVDCGKPLDDELDGGHVVCLNCRIKLRRPQWMNDGINHTQS